MREATFVQRDVALKRIALATRRLAVRDGVESAADLERALQVDPFEPEFVAAYKDEAEVQERQLFSARWLRPWRRNFLTDQQRNAGLGILSDDDFERAMDVVAVPDQVRFELRARVAAERERVLVEPSMASSTLRPSATPSRRSACSHRRSTRSSSALRRDSLRVGCVSV